MNLSFLKTLLLTLSAGFLALSLMIFPSESLEAARVGLKIWWKDVFPSLLPFFVMSELLIGFGFVQFISVLFEPFMRPLFRVPGAGGFVWAMGLTSGFPAGAKLSARLWQEKQITAIEGERLASFTNGSNPLFLFATVAAGFFNQASLGIIFAISHYVGNFFVGIIMRFHGSRHELTVQKKKPLSISPKSAFRQMHETRIKDGRPIGQLLGDAIQSSTKTLLMIGGFIVLFSVLTRILNLLHITELLAYFIKNMLSSLSISTTLSLPFISGIFEMTTGSYLASEAHAPIYQQCIITSFILGFGGFSGHAQVASILAPTKIRFKPFFFARIMHGLFAAILTAFIFHPLYKPKKETTLEVMGYLHHSTGQLREFILHYGSYFTLIALIASIFIWSVRKSNQSSLR